MRDQNGTDHSTAISARRPTVRTSFERPIGTRAQVEMVAVAMLLALTIIGGTLVLVLGTSVLEASQSDAQVGSAENAMMQLDSRASLVALGSTESQRVSLVKDKRATVKAIDTNGWMRIDITDPTNGTTDEIMNVTMGSVEYERDDTVIAYQGGGVWKRTDSGSSMVSPPEFHYRSVGEDNPTLTLPLTVIAGSATIDDTAVIKKQGSPNPKYPVLGDASKQNPLNDGEVTITVKSTYYEAWGAFFEARTGGVVTYDHPNETVHIDLVVAENQPPVGQALQATSSGGNLKIAGNGARTDSYNSSIAPYPSSDAYNGTIETAGDIEVSGGAEVKGDVVSGGDVVLKGSSAIHGDVEWTTSFTQKGGPTLNGTANQISGVDSQGSISTLVRSRLNDFATSNDNGNTTVINANTLNSTCDPCELTAGTYYIDEIDLVGRDLELNTTNGPITLGVEDYFRLEGTANVSVTGSDQVRVYLGGSDTYGGTSDHFIMSNSGGNAPTVWAAGDNSRKFWVYAPDDVSIDIQGSSSASPVFIGVVYAPAGSTGSSSAFVKNADVYGGLVAGSTEVGQNGAIHFDQALQTTSPLPAGVDAVRLTYLHVTVNTVTVEAA